MLASPQSAVGAGAPQRVLIIKPSALGDVATTLPLLCDLKEMFPKSRIDWLIDPALADLVRGHDAVNELIYFDRRKIAGWFTHGTARSNLRALMRTLNDNRYDMVLDAQGLLRSAFLARASRAPVRIGFADAREGARFLYTHHSRVSRPSALAVVRMRSLATVIGSPNDRAEFRMPIQPAALEKVAGLLPGSQSAAAVIPGARWDAKRWSEHGYSQIVRHLADFGMKVVVLGAPGEQALCQQVVDQAGVAAVNLAGRTTLAELIAAISLCRIVIGNDSGPLHVAAALGRPLVGLYGPTNPESVGPYGQMDHVLRFEQAGEYRDSGMQDRRATLLSLSVETVWKKIQNVIAR
ncbi:MAG: lipopolysaccharide heptosyltransferase I [Phycisphaerae bacterium]